ncbi:MAG: hypothetical protein ACP5QS_03130 [bacterium]
MARFYKIVAAVLGFLLLGGASRRFLAHIAGRMGDGEKWSEGS